MNVMRPRKTGSPADALAALLTQCGPIETVADFLNKRPGTIYRYTDPDQSDGMPFALVALLTEHYRATAAAEHLALRAGGVFLPIPREDDADGWGGLSAAAAEDTGHLISDIVRALAPTSEGGTRVAGHELDVILKDIDRVLRVVAALRGLAVAAKEREAR